MMKIVFYFDLKALFALKIFKFLSRLFLNVEKWSDQKDKVNFKIYDVATSLSSYCIAYIAQYLKK